MRLFIVKVPGVHLVNPANQRGHWGRFHDRAKTQRGQTRLMMTSALSKSSLLVRQVLREALDGGGPGLLIRITRYASGRCDVDDGLNISAKHVRDGVADVLGFNDNTFAVSWRYVDVPADSPSVTVEVFERAACGCCGQYVAKED